MAKRENLWILSGRFQPFHWGHLAVARSACAAMPGDSTLILAIVAPLIEVVEESGEFTSVAREHHTEDRNPWTVTTRLLALARVAEILSRDYPGKRISVSSIPRPDLGWRTLQAWFPGHRTWVVPDADEQFDEAKVAYFREKGEQVIRFNGETEMDGRSLRAQFAKDSIAAGMLLPAMVREAFVDGWPQKLEP
jgi:hypothetical protein